MIPLAKDCGCVSHEGPHELAMRDAFKAKRLATYAEIQAKPATTRSQHDANVILAHALKAEAARDFAEHCRWMHRLGLASFCRGCWQGFVHADLPAVCGCGRGHAAQQPVDLLAVAQRMDVAGHWPPLDDHGSAA